MSTLKYVSGEPNLQTVTLTSDYTAADGHMHLTAGHGARLPATGDFWIRTPATGDVLNVFKVTARSTDDLTVTCVTGYGADANRAAGTVFSWTMAGEALDQFRSDLVQTGADASKAAEKAGNLYLPSDGVALHRDTGVAFASWGPLFPLVPFINADFSDLNTPIVATTGGGIHLSTAASAGDQIRGRVKNAPGGPYTFTVGIIPHFADRSYHRAGLCVYDGTKLLVFGCGETNRLCSIDYTNVTTYSGDNVSTIIMSASPLFFRYQDDETNRILSWSVDNQNFITVLTEGRTTFLTATQIGVFVHVADGSYGTAMRVIHWSQS